MAYVNNDGWQIWYETFGSGPPPVCTGGIVMMHNQFDWVTEALSKHFTVVHWNWRGAGRSDRTWVHGIGYEEFVSDLRAVVDALGLKRAHFWGAGNGAGAIPLRFAGRYPERVDRLVLWPFFKAPPPAGPFNIYLELARRSMEHNLWATWYSAASAEAIDNGDVVRLFRAELEMAKRNTPFEVYERFASIWAPVDFSTDVSRLAAPVLLLAGGSGLVGADSPGTAAAIRGFRELCPAASLAVIPRAGGTVPMIEQPDLTVAAVRKFLGG